jgi:Excalibur calcium-binding domain
MRMLRDLRGGAGLLVLGAAIGGGGFLLVDSFREPTPASLSVHYSTCRDAMLDGRTNIARSEPGYRAALDADGDGLACEPYHPR